MSHINSNHMKINENTTYFSFKTSIISSLILKQSKSVFKWFAASNRRFQSLSFQLLQLLSFPLQHLHLNEATPAHIR